jgi:hypothetical protein
MGDKLNARDWSDTLTKIVTSGIMNKKKHPCQETFQNKWKSASPNRFRLTLSAQNFSDNS